MTRVLPIERSQEVVTLAVEVDGTELPQTIPILAVQAYRQVNRIPFAKLRIGDGDPATGDFPLSAGEHFVPGNELAILAGYQGESQAIFVGVVTRQRVVVRREGSWLEVECRDPTFKMTLTRRNAHFEESTDSEIAETLIGAYGLTADIAATEVTHPLLLQYQATDWDFLISRLEANGQLCVAGDGAVRSFVPSIDAEPEAVILYGATLLELDAEFDARSQTAAIRAQAWDPAGQELLDVAATDPSWVANNDLETGSLVEASGREEDLLWHGGSVASDALQAWADGALLRNRLAGSRGRARFQGLPGIEPGQVLELSGLGTRFNGKVHVTGVRHELTDGDWLTDVEFGLSPECQAEQFPISHVAAAGLVPAVGGLQIGVVTELAGDPAGEHRVRVKIPVAGFDEQGVWARVATLDAGNERGSFFRPEVDDEVVLGFLHDDPGQPVVLGMLHSSAKAPPVEPSEENHERAYVSRSGIKLHFDDDQVVVSLETPGGNRLALTDADGGLVIEDQNGNSLTMDSAGISLESAAELSLVAATDWKAEGLNAELKASASLKAEGGASAEVSSSGTMTVKGSLVQIN